MASTLMTAPSSDLAGSVDVSGVPGTEAPGDAEVALAALRSEIAGMAERMRAAVDQVPDERGLDGVPVAAFDGCFADLKRVEGAVAALKARLVACVSAARAFEEAGLADAGAYLRDRLGLSGREAKRQTELSRSVGDMEGAADALADGQLGIEQAAVLGRAVSNGHLGDSDEVERDLLKIATESSPEELQRTVRKREQQADADALRRDENRAYALRRASISKQHNGMWALHADLDPVNGELVATAIRAYMTPDDKGTPPGQRRSADKRTADALAELANAALNAGAPTGGGVRPHVSVVVMAEPPEAGDGDDAAGRGNRDARHEVGDGGSGRPVHGACGSSGGPCGGAATSSGGPCDGAATSSGGPCGGAATSRDAWLSPGGVPSPPHGVGVTGAGTVLSPAATARLVCDSALSRVVMAGPSQVLDVGRATRSWSGPQRRAIVARDGRCRGPGCDRPPSWCDIHHIWWWRHGGPTDLANGILLCRRHHRLLHEGGWSVTLDRDTGRAVFTDPRGKDHATLPRGAPTLLG